MENSPDEILRRLEELRCWQGVQQQKLLSKQLTSSQICTMEQQKLCEMFGLSTLTSTISNLSDLNERPQTPTIKSVNDALTDRNTSVPEEQFNDQSGMYADNVRDTPQKCFRVETPINNFSLDELESFGKEDENLNANFEDKPKRSFLKRGQGLAARFKIDPGKLRIDNLPKYKFANSHKRSKFFRDHKQLSTTDNHRLDLIPKPKPVIGDTKLAKQDVVSVPKTQNPPVGGGYSREINVPCGQRPVAKKIPQSVTWANVLGSEQKNAVPRPPPHDDNVFSTPTMAEKTQKQRQDQRDLQIFELLEQNLNNSALLQNTDVMKQLVNYMLTTQSSIQGNAQVELSFDQATADVSSNGVGVKRNVRFAIDARDNEDSECETIASVDIEEMDSKSNEDIQTSTPITKTPFELFKQNLFAESDSTLIDKYCKDNTMKLRNDELKERLTELQNEIELFRQQNALLTKTMREHEVEKLLWEEQKNEMLEKIEDERIRQEVHLHDERMKLADEQRKLDKRAKELRAPNRKDKEDMAKVKQECADLQKELANRDQKHIGAQARLRAQIRNMEKDLKEFSMEIDNLRKENKKIESENVRLRRQNNNKMLNEINKNIAKLAPKLDAQVAVDRKDSNKNPQSIETQSQSDNKTKSKIGPIEVKEIPKTCETDDSDDTDVSSSSSSTTTNRRSSYFKDGQRQSTKEKLSTPVDDIPMLESNSSSNLKREIVNADGSRDIWYPNGNLKKVSADEMVIRMLYFNKDVKETNIHEGTVKYYYAEANTWQTTYLDGLEIWEFPNGRNEHHYKDGRIEAHHPDGSICTTNPNDMETAEEWKYLNGTTFVIKRNGDKYLNLPNGQREVTTKNHVRREYPDGTVKIKYPDGSLESRYSNGRVRLRDAAGTLIRDSEAQ